MRNAGPASLTMLPGEEHPAWPDLRDLAFTLATEAAALTGRLAPGTASAVGDLVRGMNCYYSNLIEGHDTRPVDIERGLRADLAAEPKRRDLQLEAAAHIAVQAAIDTGALDTTNRCASRSAAILYGSVLHAISLSALRRCAELAQQSFPRRVWRIARHLDTRDIGPVYGVQCPASI